MDESEWIDEAEAARILHVKPQTLYRYRMKPPASGFKKPLPYYRFGRKVQYRRSEFLAWIDLHSVRAEERTD